MSCNIGLISVFKNEDHILEEWITHYRNQGVDHFFLVDNDSNDNYMQILRKYIDQNIVTLAVDPTPYAQVDHLNKFLHECANYNWIIVVDLDEFVYARNGYNTIKEYLSVLPKEISSVHIPWKMFGSNGHFHQPPSVIPHFTTRMQLPETENYSICSKSISRGNKITSLNLHACQFNDPNGISITSCNMEQLDQNALTSVNASEQILQNSCLHLNHYAIQSWGYFSNIKMTRGDATSPNIIRNEEYFKSYDWNQKVDEELNRAKG